MLRSRCASPRPPWPRAPPARSRPPAPRPTASRQVLHQDRALSNVATPTTDYATGAAFLPIPIPPRPPTSRPGYGSVYTVGFDHSGNLKVIQGTIVPLDASGNFINAPQFGGLGPSGLGLDRQRLLPDRLHPRAARRHRRGDVDLRHEQSQLGDRVTYTFVDVATCRTARRSAKRLINVSRQSSGPGALQASGPAFFSHNA
jgi:hypothetical protein